MNVAIETCHVTPPIWPQQQHQQHDYVKNDFQNAVRRNLHIWVQWRTRLNDNLVDAVMTGSQLNNVEPFKACLNRDSPDPDHPTSNPKTLLTFSASTNSSTNLHTKDFYKYGIPRAKVDPQVHRLSQTVARVDIDDDAKQQQQQQQQQRVGETVPAIVVTERAPVDSISSQDDDEFVMDYFNYQVGSSPSASTSSLRRFHRSEATLPVAPSVADVVKDRRTQKSKKSEERSRSRLPPSYVEPFIGSRIITARRDHDVLYTRSALHLDELL